MIKNLHNSGKLDIKHRLKDIFKKKSVDKIPYVSRKCSIMTFSSKAVYSAMSDDVQVTTDAKNAVHCVTLSETVPRRAGGGTTKLMARNFVNVSKLLRVAGIML